MCSYCGCEAEPVIETLMGDHAAIGVRARRITDALDGRHFRLAEELVAELAGFFDRHARMEEAGLFAQLRRADEATEELDRLVGEHRRLLGGLGRPDIVENPHQLRVLLVELRRHAEIEDTDLFPFAMQVVPNPSWDLVEQAHQQLLTT